MSYADASSGLYALSWVLPATVQDNMLSLGAGAFLLSIVYCLTSLMALVSGVTIDSVVHAGIGLYFGFLAIGNAYVFADIKQRIPGKSLWLIKTLYLIGIWTVPLVVVSVEVQLAFGYYVWAIGATGILALSRQAAADVTECETP